MKRFVAMLATVACLGLVGCAKPAPKSWVPTSGSRADATVKLSYEYNPNTEIPQVNEAQALEAAKKRCSSWGYSDAEAFGGVLGICTQMVPAFGGPQCLQRIVTKEYQCIGRGDSKVPAENTFNR